MPATPRQRLAAGLVTLAIVLVILAIVWRSGEMGRMQFEIGDLKAENAALRQQLNGLRSTNRR